MATLQDYFEWVRDLSDGDATFAVLGLGIVLGRRGDAGWTGTARPTDLLEECRWLARQGTLKVHLSRTWRLIDRLHPFLGDAKRLADFGRQVIDGRPTWLVMPDLEKVCADIEGIRLTGTRGLPHPVVTRQDVYRAMLANMGQRNWPNEMPRDSDLALVRFWSGPIRASDAPRRIVDHLGALVKRWLGTPGAGDEWLTSRFGFRWPLRLRDVSGPPSRILDELRLIQKDWMLPLIAVEPPGDGRADVLLIDGRIAGGFAAEEVANAAIVVVVSRPGGELPSSVPKTITDWLTGTPGPRPAAVICVQPNGDTSWAPPSFVTRWVVEFVRALSHDTPLLASAFAASVSKHAASMPSVFSLLNPVQHDRRLSDMVPEQLREFRADPDRWIDLSGPAAARFGVSPGLRPLGDLPDRLRGMGDFLQESRDATTIAEVFRSFDHRSTFSAEEIDVARWLQAQVLDDGERVCDAFRTDGRYTVRVWIGPERPGSIRADVRFPSERIDWTDDVERLTVVFTEPTYARDPQIRTIDLPRAGHSTTCDFMVDTALPLGRQAPPVGIRARVAILHRNRVLQTAFLAGEFSEATPRGDDRRIRLEIEGVVRPDLNDLRGRTPFGAAMIVNETPEHEHTLVAVSSSPEGSTAATFRPLTDILDTMKLLSKELTKVASREQPPDWGSPEVEQLFRVLATHGYDVYRVLVKEQGKGMAERVANATHLQVVAADEQVYFPIELFYNRPPPLSTARVCPAAKDALRANACPTDCPGLADTDNYVCPRGFLGMQKIIERHVCGSEASGGLESGSFHMQMEPSSGHGSLPVFERVVYGASKRVWGYRPPLMPPLEATVTSLCPGGPVAVTNWEELKAKSIGASLLVLIPHCEMDPLHKYESLEIGTGEKAWPLILSDLRRGHLGLAADEKRPVVVLLMGCETGSPDADYRGFAAKFREHGAAVVVTALSKVLGRQVVPVTRALLLGISEALAGGDPVRLGELLTEQRRKLLADGYALAIGLTAYGDADWVLVATPSQVKEVAHVVS